MNTVTETMTYIKTWFNSLFNTPVSINPTRKLTDHDVQTIFILKADNYTIREIGDILEVSSTTISNVLNRKTYKDVNISGLQLGKG